MNRPRPVMVMILDGWGIAEDGDGNAVSRAKTPFLDRLLAQCPHTRLQTSGPAVGLPEGVMGNSEVGHMNIGAGRVVYQDLLRIDKAIADETFFANPVLNRVMERVSAGHSTLHLMGLVSDGGVHSQLTHLTALLKMAQRKGLDRVMVHAIMDGRDTSPNGGEGYLDTVVRDMARIGVGKVATICGRYFAMDRDTRWDRIEKAYRLYTRGQGRPAADPLAAIRKAYNDGQTDEFIEPIVICDEQQAPLTRVDDEDGIIFFNFRADRAREITRAFTEAQFDGFARSNMPRLADYVCMTLYDEAFTLPIAFAPVHLDGILGQVISDQGLKQLRIAETEKYAHVTYFFNGGEETPFAGEDRCLVPSPRDVATYDQKPAMSAEAVTDEVIERIAGGTYDMIVLNFANMDMVGHTGVFPAAVAACEKVDRCAARIVTAITGRGGVVLMTADHGNAETMVTEDGRVHTAHTTHPVHLVLAGDAVAGATLRSEGVLGDIAPTVLDIMGIDPPEQMTGRSLLGTDD